MTTVLSSKGQVVLNASIRRSLGLSPGTVFNVRCERRKIVLDPVTPGRAKGRAVRDARTGAVVLDVDADVPSLTSERVRDLLADFP